jgi:hypothetical protein
MQNAWMMLNNVKCAQGWTTMASHVYNVVYCKVMIIVVCDMQFEDMEAQCILWRKLNVAIEKKR